MVTRKRTQTQDPHHPVLSDGFCTIIVDEYSVVLLVFSTILMIYKNKKNAVSLLPVLRTSLPVTALMWRFCLAGNTKGMLQRVQHCNTEYNWLCEDVTSCVQSEQCSRYNRAFRHLYVLQNL